MAGDTGEVRLNLPALGVAGAAKDNVIQGVDGTLLGRGLVGGGPRHHVGPHHQVQLPPREDLPQAEEVRRCRQIYGDVMGEEVDVKLVGNRHTDDLPPDQRGLGLFGPGELVHRQIDLHAQVPDGGDDALVGEGEGVESAGEEGGGLIPPLKVEGAALNAVRHGEAVDVGEGGGGVEKGQLPSGLLADEEEELFGNQGEQADFVVIGQHLGGKQPLPQNPQGLLPHGLHAGGQAL